MLLVCELSVVLFAFFLVDFDLEEENFDIYDPQNCFDVMVLFLQVMSIVPTLKETLFISKDQDSSLKTQTSLAEMFQA